MHILFDADWTFLATDLLDAKKLWVDSDILTEFFIKEFPPTVTGDANLKEILPPYLTKMWRTWSLEEFLHLRFTSQNQIRDWMLELLKKLQTQWHRCSLCTQQEINRSNYMRKEMWFEELFDSLYFTAEIWFAKKDKRFFETIIQQSWISAEETIFVDDKEKYCDAAKNAWIMTYHFNWDVVAYAERLKEIL